MAILTSPGINVSEFNLTTAVPGVSTSVGGFAGHFAWGPASEITQVTSEVNLVNRFGKPNVSNYEDFFTAANFLAYANNLSVVRMADAAKNACAGATSALVQNSTVYYQGASGAILNAGAWIAKYPGTMGNAISVYTLDNGNIGGATGPIAGATGVTIKSVFAGATGWCYRRHYQICIRRSHWSGHICVRHKQRCHRSQR